MTQLASFQFACIFLVAACIAAIPAVKEIWVANHKIRKYGGYYGGPGPVMVVFLCSALAFVLGAIGFGLLIYAYMHS